MLSSAQVRILLAALPGRRQHATQHSPSGFLVGVRGSERSESPTMRSRSVTVSTLDSESGNPSSNLGGTLPRLCTLSCKIDRHSEGRVITVAKGETQVAHEEPQPSSTVFEVRHRRADSQERSSRCHTSITQ
jgi:hypothetical protein